jgi:hypothetical protein
MQERLRCESRPRRSRRLRSSGGFWRWSLGLLILGGGMLDAVWLAPMRDPRGGQHTSRFEAMRRCRNAHRAAEMAEAMPAGPAAATATGAVISGPDYIEVDVITADSK